MYIFLLVAFRVTVTPSYTPNMPSPANSCSSLGPSSSHRGSGLAADPVSSTVAVPQSIGQMAVTYVNITTLFLSAYDIWEQAEELAQKGSGKNGWKRECYHISMLNQNI